MTRKFPHELLEDARELSSYRGRTEGVYRDFLAVRAGSLSAAEFGNKYRRRRANPAQRDEMNRASKLGEDIARANETLLTERAFEAVGQRAGNQPGGSRRLLGNVSVFVVPRARLELAHPNGH